MARALQHWLGETFPRAVAVYVAAHLAMIMLGIALSANASERQGRPAAAAYAAKPSIADAMRPALEGARK